MGFFNFFKRDISEEEFQEQQKVKRGLEKTRTGFFQRIVNTLTNAQIDDDLYDQLEEQLILADTGAGVAVQLVDELRARVRSQRLKTGAEALDALKDIVKEHMQAEKELDLSGHPAVILVIGVNGVGKTTSIAKLAHYYKDAGKTVLLAAGDTFRAAAVEQLEVWGQRCGIRVFKGPAGCDAAGLCYDGLTEAVRQKDDIVFIDTAGRLQNKTGLMDELKKIVRVIGKVLPKAPHATLLTIDATTGQNALSQVQTFKEMVDVTGLVVTKLDGTAKGGILVAVAEEQPSPIHYIGVGEGIDDLDVFNAADYAKNLLEL